MTWRNLSKADRQAFRRAAQEASVYERAKIEKITQKYLTELAAKGMKINKVPDKKPFEKAVKPMYSEFKKEIGPGVMQAVLTARDKAEQ